MPQVHPAQVDCLCDVPGCLYMKEIKLTKGFVALVDDEDYEKVNKIKWCYNGGYVKHNTTIRIEKHKYKTKTTLMHRLIMNPPDNMDIDHRNHNPLDNRKENLRICTHHENMMNRLKRNKLGVMGVSMTKTGKYAAFKTIEGKNTYLGVFDTLAEAQHNHLIGRRVIVNKPFAKKISIMKTDRFLNKCIDMDATYSLQYVDYASNEFTAPVKMTKERLNKILSDHSVKRIIVKIDIDL